MPESNLYPYRIFISYARDDDELATRIIEILKKLSLKPMRDRDLTAGTPFTSKIREMISRAHIFMPILTPTSVQRAWVHQEIGYATALNIPFLPIAFGNALPNAMMGDIHAIQADFDLSGLEESLRKFDFDQLVLPPPTKPFANIEIVETPFERTQMIVKGAQWAADLGEYGMVRQQGWIGSFSIPSVTIDDPIWTKREGNSPRSTEYRALQREERNILERHGRMRGCRLILNFQMPARGVYKDSQTHRRTIFRDFLIGMPDNTVEIALSYRLDVENLLILGDHYCMDSRIYSTSGYSHAAFFAHPPTVLRKIQQFDRIFNELPTKLNRDEAVRLLNQLIDHPPE